LGFGEKAKIIFTFFLREFHGEVLNRVKDFWEQDLGLRAKEASRLLNKLLHRTATTPCSIPSLSTRSIGAYLPGQARD
jgi:hypothetical protein